MNKEYKYKFLTCKVNIDEPHQLMKDMINEYIKKLRADIEKDSSPDSKYGAERIKVNANKIVELLSWRDNMEFVGSDEVFEMNNLQGTDRLHKFWLY